MQTNGPRFLPRVAREDGGFTMVEVLVASLLLIVGVFATLALLDRGNAATASSTQRDGANAIAEELVERASGARYDAIYNDLTDRRTVAPPSGAPVYGGLTGTPAERFRRAMDPDSTLASAPITETDAVHPWLSRSTWPIRRGTTTYRVTYHACTESDVVDGIQIAGPNDCARPATDPTDHGGGGSSDCRIGFIPPGEVQSDTPLDVRLQLLGSLGLQVCVGALPLGLGELSSSLCNLLNNSASGALNNLLQGLTSPAGLLSNLQNTIGLGLLGANVPLCPGAVEGDITDARAGVATSTRVDVEVTWTERGATRSIRQATVVRRPATAITGV